MERLFAYLLFSLMSIYTFAQGMTTTDKISISSETLQPGGSEVKIVVSLDGNEHLYTGYEMDITLPEGVEMNYYNGDIDVTMYKNGTLYPYTEDRDGNKSFTHSVSCSYGKVAPQVLRLTCTSTKNEAFLTKGGALFTMYLKATTYAKPGLISLGLSNCKFVTYDATTTTTTGYSITQASISGITIGNQGTALLDLSTDTHWSTLILPFSTAIPSGVIAYTCSNKDDNQNVLLLEAASSIAAFTPYILYTENDVQKPVSAIISDYPNSSVITDGYLVGALSPQTISDGYVLQNLSEGVKFYNCDGKEFVIPAGKCWVSLPDGSKAKDYGFSIVDTGIKQIQSECSSYNLIHTLSGQRISTPIKEHIYIINGRKIFWR